MKPSHDNITQVQLASPEDVAYWTQRLHVSHEELVGAVNVVGTSVADVEAYLTRSQESMGSYVVRMRSRLNQIEFQLEQLTDERKGIVAFLEGFARLQRNPRPAFNALALAMGASDESTKHSPDYLKAVEVHMHLSGNATRLQREVRNSLSHGHAVPWFESAIPELSASSSTVPDLVYHLLQDGKRRTVHEILGFLEVRGVPLKGANPPGLLSTMLSRDSRFEPSRRDGWGLSTDS